MRSVRICYVYLRVRGYLRDNLWNGNSLQLFNVWRLNRRGPRVTENFLGALRIIRTARFWVFSKVSIFFLVVPKSNEGQYSITGQIIDLYVASLCSIRKNFLNFELRYSNLLALEVTDSIVLKKITWNLEWCQEAEASQTKWCL